MAKAKKKRSSRDAMEAAIATLREHAKSGFVAIGDVDSTSGRVTLSVHWLNDAETDRPMLMDAASILDKNPNAWG